MMITGLRIGLEDSMYRFDRKHILAFTFATSASVLCAATPAIGVAVSQGNMIVNSGETPGNATIFEGSTLQTETTASQVQMKDGARVQFASESRGKLFFDHVDLQEGSAKVSGYPINANGLSIRPDKTGTAAISIHGKAVEVAALTGNVHVFNAQGINVGNLMPGRALSFAPQDAGASAPSSLTGCAVKSKDQILLTDENTNVTSQLRGSKVKTGKHITVTGSIAGSATPVSGATQVVDVASVKDAAGACKSAAAIAAAAGGAGAAAGGAAAGAGAGAAAAEAGAAAAGVAGIGVTTAVVVGVAAAAAIGTGVAVATTGGTTSPGQ